MTRGIYVVGTDTDAGKTIVSAAFMYILRSSGYNAAYFKAALSGALSIKSYEDIKDSSYKKSEDEIYIDTDNQGRLVPGDTRFVCKFSNFSEDINLITPYIYKNAVSPHLACKLEENEIDIDKVKDNFNILKSKYRYIIAEGSGGIVCPLIDSGKEVYCVYDLIKDLNMDVILVAKAGLGTINHTVITVEYIKSLGINIKGIVINGYRENIMCKDNIEMIKKLTNVSILGIMPHIDGLDVERLQYENLKSISQGIFNADRLVSIMGQLR